MIELPRQRTATGLQPSTDYDLPPTWKACVAPALLLPFALLYCRLSAHVQLITIAAVLGFEATVRIILAAQAWRRWSAVHPPRCRLQPSTMQLVFRWIHLIEQQAGDGSGIQTHPMPSPFTRSIPSHPPPVPSHSISTEPIHLILLHSSPSFPPDRATVHHTGPRRMA